MVPRNTKLRLPSLSGSLMMRGRGTRRCTTARPLLRPNWVLALDHDREVQALVENFWERPGRIQGQWAEHRPTSRVKYSASQAAWAPVQFSGETNTTPLALSSGMSTSFSNSYCSSTKRWRVRMAFSCSGTGSPSGPFLAPRPPPAVPSGRQRGSRRTHRGLRTICTEISPFQQRNALVLGLVQDSLVELQKRDFAIDVELRACRSVSFMRGGTSPCRAQKLTANCDR